MTLPLPSWLKLTSLSRTAKVAVLETENTQLRATNALQASEKAALQQLLTDARERQEQRERENLETYEEKLKLESALAAIKQGDAIQGYPSQSPAGNHQAHEVYSTGQKRSAELEAEVSALKEQLQRSEKERMSGESRYQKTIELQSNTLSGLLSDQKKRQSLGNGQAPGHDEKAAQRKTENSDRELQEILHKLKMATADRRNQEDEESRPSVDYPISSLVDKLINSKERLAKRAAVQQDILSPPAELGSVSWIPQSPRRPQFAFCPPTTRSSQATSFPQSPRLPQSPRCAQSPCVPEPLQIRSRSWRSLTGTA